MFARALLAFLALPGVVAFAVPVTWLYSSGDRTLVHPLGLAPLLAGIAALLWCARDFYVAGRGTLAPWAPPANLVVVGLYRYTRNPMYVAVTLILLGWAAAFASRGLLVYARWLRSRFICGSCTPKSRGSRRGTARPGRSIRSACRGGCGRGGAFHHRLARAADVYAMSIW
jgi:protein-S-isoprenylcysteine O-methyltransferase Ste14